MPPFPIHYSVLLRHKRAIEMATTHDRDDLLHDLCCLAYPSINAQNN
jgi:hypothetical protein